MSDWTRESMSRSSVAGDETFQPALALFQESPRSHTNETRSSCDTNSRKRDSGGLDVVLPPISTLLGETHGYSSNFDDKGWPLKSSRKRPSIDEMIHPTSEYSDQQLQPGVPFSTEGVATSDSHSVSP